MIYGIPLLRNRIAPRCTIADSILLLEVDMNRIVHKKSLRTGEMSWNDLLRIFNENKVDTLVCGGIDYANRKLSTEQGLSIIDNVACSENEVIQAIESKVLKPGLGLSPEPDLGLSSPHDVAPKKHIGTQEIVDCLVCREKSCLAGKACVLSSKLSHRGVSKEIRQILHSALDISLEDERILCRLSELVYFALEMKYEKIGIAYCVDLSEATEIVTQVLRRFFTVFPVCCKVGGKETPDSLSTETSKVVCNPVGQAEILNVAAVDFSIIIGLCIGTDGIFTKLSNAPVSTLFVKDKSLANNPIAAVYLDHYLKEVDVAALNH